MMYVTVAVMVSILKTIPVMGLDLMKFRVANWGGYIFKCSHFISNNCSRKVMFYKDLIMTYF